MKFKLLSGIAGAAILTSSVVMAGGHMNKDEGVSKYDTWKHELAVKLHLSEEQIGYLDEYVKESRDKKREMLAKKCGVDLNDSNKEKMRETMVTCMKNM